MKTLPILAIWITVCYLAGAFIAWDFNPADWHPVNRATVVVLVVGVIAMIFSPDKED